MQLPTGLPAGRTAAEPPITWPQAMVTLLATLCVFAAGGLAAGWTWWAVTETRRYEVTRRLPDPLPAGAVDTSSFDSDARFVVVAVVAGLLCGFGCTALFRLRGLVTLGSVLVGAILASFLAYRLGTALGPGPIADQADGARVGDVLTFPLQVDSGAAFVVWPIAAVAGLMLGVSMLTPVPNTPVRDPSIG